MFLGEKEMKFAHILIEIEEIERSIEISYNSQKEKIGKLKSDIIRISKGFTGTR